MLDPTFHPNPSNERKKQESTAILTICELKSNNFTCPITYTYSHSNTHKKLKKCDFKNQQN